MPWIWRSALDLALVAGKGPNFHGFLMMCKTAVISISEHQPIALQTICLNGRQKGKLFLESPGGF